MWHGAEAKARGQICGNATWVANLWTPGDELFEGGDWVKVLRHTYMRPEESQVLLAMSSWFGCNQQGQNERPCGENRCPYCWYEKPQRLLLKEMHCSRILWGVPAVSSSGLGRIRGGDVRASAADGPAHAWGLGAGGGEDVKIFRTQEALKKFEAQRQGGVVPHDLTLARIVHFFVHDGNPSTAGAGEEVVVARTAWVVC